MSKPRPWQKLWAIQEKYLLTRSTPPLAMTKTQANSRSTVALESTPMGRGHFTRLWFGEGEGIHYPEHPTYDASRRDDE